MSFFKPRVSFPLNYASPFSVMTRNSYEIFWPKHYMLWTKVAHQSTIFQNFECSNESSLNSSCHFWNQKVRVYSNFVQSSVPLKITPLNFCGSNLEYFGQKEHIEKNFQTFQWLGENLPNSSCHIEITCQFFFKLCITLQCHAR